MVRHLTSPLQPRFHIWVFAAGIIALKKSKVQSTVRVIVAVTWQLTAEAIVALNGAAGRSVGARAQLLLFLNDLIPAVFGKPLLSP
jgi:hypothetical protein